MMENTLENKAKFIALYWGQHVLTSEKHKHEEFHYQIQFNLKPVTESWFLELKSVSSISDEDALYLARMYQRLDKESGLFAYNSDESAIRYVKNNIHLFFSHDSESVDYLRSKGYAVKAFGLSVEEQVNRGWVILI